MTIYKLEERTAQFGENVIIYCKSIKFTPIVHPLVSQLVRSATSIGANYMEANAASSKKDFRNKIHICKKETQETKHWLRMLEVALGDSSKTLISMKQEAEELTLIFGKIISSIKKNDAI